MSDQNNQAYDQETGEVIGEVIGRAQGGLAAKESFGSIEVAQQNETAIAAVQARAQAIVQSKYVMALKRPRNPEQVREDLLKDCRRSSFADVARYKRPQGKRPAWLISEGGKETEVPEGTSGARKAWVPNFIEGPSIRFVEAALRALGNCEPAVQALYEDERKMIVRVEVCDFEKNLSFSQEITIEKSVERKDLKKDRDTGEARQVPLAVRTNSYGDRVYIVPASEDETRLKVNRLVSMTMRTLGLRLIPGDLLDEAMQQVTTTQKESVKGDPAKARRELLDSFAKLGIRASDLADYLGGRTVEQASPDEILELRIMGVAIRDGELKWLDALAASPYRVAEEEQAKASPQQAKIEKVKEHLAAKISKAKDAAKAAKAAKEAPAAGAPATAAEPSKGAAPAAASAEKPKEEAPKAEPEKTAAPDPREPGSDG